MTTTHKLIAKQTVGANGIHAIRFSNIPQTFTDLKIIITARSKGNADNFTSGYINFNSDYSASYSGKFLRGSTPTVTSGSNTGQTRGTFNYIFNGNAAGSSIFSNTYIYIPNYTSSNQKSGYCESVTENNAEEAWQTFTSFHWDNTQAIEDILIVPFYSGNELFAQHSTFALYGISKTLSATNTVAPYASGGDVVSTDGTYWYHTFLNSGTFSPIKNLTCDFLVVAGGGGGGAAPGSGGVYGAGGGGAGGLRTSAGPSGGGAGAESRLSLTPTSYPVTIGAGGAAFYNGSNSSFASVTSIGGGAGFYSGSNVSNNGVGDGGSGGAQSYATYGTGSGSQGGAGTAGQGFRGGAGISTGYKSGSGGGAGAQGTTDADGGIGVLSSISGVPTYYAGGGAAGSQTTRYGGLGGGGNQNVSGAPNTGGGGGGRYGASSGASGGSGVVIIRYAV